MPPTSADSSDPPIPAKVPLGAQRATPRRPILLSPRTLGWDGACEPYGRWGLPWRKSHVSHAHPRGLHSGGGSGLLAPRQHRPHHAACSEASERMWALPRGDLVIAALAVDRVHGNSCSVRKQSAGCSQTSNGHQRSTWVFRRSGRYGHAANSCHLCGASPSSTTTSEDKARNRA